MKNIRFIHGPRAGQMVRLADKVADSLVVAGLADHMRPSPPRTWIKPTCTFAVEVLNQRVLCITTKCGTFVHHFCGNPKMANATKPFAGGDRPANGSGRYFPKDIVEKYAVMWKRNPHLRTSERNVIADALQKVGEVKPLVVLPDDGAEISHYEGQTEVGWG
jgi:hypothetical protein